MRIALDAMGGDRGPDELVDGAVQAVSGTGLEVTLLGNEEQLKAALSKYRQQDAIRVVGTSQVVSMDESPFEAVRKKRDSSIVKAFDLLKKGIAKLPSPAYIKYGKGEELIPK